MTFGEYVMVAFVSAFMIALLPPASTIPLIPAIIMFVISFTLYMLPAILYQGIKAIYRKIFK